MDRTPARELLRLLSRPEDRHAFPSYRHRCCADNLFSPTSGVPKEAIRHPTLTCESHTHTHTHTTTISSTHAVHGKAHHAPT